MKISEGNRTKILLWTCAICVFAGLWLVQSYVVAAKYQNLQKQFREIGLIDGSRQVEERSNHHPGSAYIERFYSTNSSAEQITAFYFRELREKGWTYKRDSIQQAEGFKEAKVSVFSKGDYLAKLYIPNAGNPSEYWLALSWGLP